jgi:hypothetical protein
MHYRRLLDICIIDALIRNRWRFHPAVCMVVLQHKISANNSNRSGEANVAVSIYYL